MDLDGDVVDSRMLPEDDDEEGPVGATEGGLPTNAQLLRAEALSHPVVTLRLLAASLTADKRRPRKRLRRVFYGAFTTCLAAVTTLDEVDCALVRAVGLRCVSDCTGALLGMEYRKSAQNCLVATARFHGPVLVAALVSKAWAGPLAMPEVAVLAILTRVLSEHATAMEWATVTLVLRWTVPTLGRIQGDDMRVAIAQLVGAVCEVAVELELAGAAGLAAAHEVDLCSCYESVAGRWLVGSNVSVRSASAAAFGALCKVIPASRFHADVANAIPRVVAAIDNARPLPALSGLSALISRCAVMGFRGGEFPASTVRLVLDTALSFRSSKKPGVRDASHVLREAGRCVEQLALFEPDAVLQHLSHLVERAGAQSASADLLRLVCTSFSDATFNTARQSAVVVTLKALLGKHKLAWTRDDGLAKLNLIACVASRGALLLEGGDKLVDWVISALINPALAQAACDFLYLCVRSVPHHVVPRLWPQLLNYVVAPGFDAAVGLACRVCTAVFQYLSRDGPPLFDWSAQSNLCSVHEVLCRLLVLLGDIDNRQRCREVVGLLHVLAPILHPALDPNSGGSAIWVLAMGEMQSFLDSMGTEPVSRDRWFGLVQEFVAVTTSSINDEQFLQELADVYVRHVREHYAGKVLLRFVCIEELRLFAENDAKLHFGAPIARSVEGTASM